MSVSRQMARSARKTNAKRDRLAGSTNVLATGVFEQDNMRVGLISAARKVTVTDRPTIRARFTAPRIDMGEYTPVSTHATELYKYTQDWSA